MLTPGPPGRRREELATELGAFPSGESFQKSGFPPWKEVQNLPRPKEGRKYLLRPTLRYSDLIGTFFKSSPRSHLMQGSSWSPLLQEEAVCIKFSLLAQEEETPSGFHLRSFLHTTFLGTQGHQPNSSALGLTLFSAPALSRNLTCLS